MTTLFAFAPLGAIANEESKQALAQDILSLLTFRNDTTRISFTGCTIEIETDLQASCPHPSMPAQTQTTLALSEVETLEVAPFREAYVLTAYIDVPSPSVLRTQINHLTMGTDAALEIYHQESQRLLEESDSQSVKTRTSCDGSVYVDKSRQVLIFLDAELEHFAQLQDLVAQCRR